LCCDRLELRHLDPALEDSTADYDEDVDFKQLQDTSHVSVVTVGEEKEHVKDSASVDGTDTRTSGSHGDGRSSKSDSGKHSKACSALNIISFLIRTLCSCRNSPRKTYLELTTRGDPKITGTDLLRMRAF
jgi:hypothetical protein